jgi:hypothetical protein
MNRGEDLRANVSPRRGDVFVFDNRAATYPPSRPVVEHSDTRRRGDIGWHSTFQAQCSANWMARFDGRIVNR